MRAYGAVELTAAGERDDALDGLVRCAPVKRRAGAGLAGPAQGDGSRVRDDLENHRTALGWLIESRRADEAANIAWNLLFFWLIQGRGTEALQWFKQTLSISGIAPGGGSQGPRRSGRDVVHRENWDPRGTGSRAP